MFHQQAKLYDLHYKNLRKMSIKWIEMLLLSSMSLCSSFFYYGLAFTVLLRFSFEMAARICYSL